MRQVYLIAAILGFVLTYAFFVPFLIENGFNLPLIFTQLNANRISIMAGVDILISSIVFWIWMFSEGRRLGIRHLWVFVVLNLTVGLSLALPLFLYVREGKRHTLEASA